MLIQFKIICNIHIYIYSYICGYMCIYMCMYVAIYIYIYSMKFYIEYTDIKDIVQIAWISEEAIVLKYYIFTLHVKCVKRAIPFFSENH